MMQSGLGEIIASVILTSLLLKMVSFQRMNSIKQATKTVKWLSEGEVSMIALMMQKTILLIASGATGQGARDG